MPEYLIEHKIKTLSELWDPFEYKGFHFSNWDFSGAKGCIGSAWLASQTIEAENANNAFTKFLKDLADIVERIGFISQCSTTISAQPFLVWKQNSNKDNIFYLFNSREAGPVPLHFQEEEKDALFKLEKFDKQDVFKYLNESTNTETYYTRLAMLIISLESIAGDRKAIEKCSCGKLRKYEVTDKDKIKAILNDPKLYDDIFNYNTGLRNKIFHGKSIKANIGDVGKIYKKIVEYFNKKYDIKISTDIVNPQRTFGGNYRASRCFWKPKGEFRDISLKDLLALSEDEFNRNFEIVSAKDY